MNQKKILIKVLLITVALSFSVILFAIDPDTGIVRGQLKTSKDSDNSSLETAVFVRNNGGKELNNEINTFNDMLCSKLADKGISVMTWKDIIQKFSESDESDDNIYKYAQSFMVSATTTPTNSSMTTAGEVSKNSEPEHSMTAETKDGGIAKSSALRISQILDAKYMIVASMGKLGHERKVFNGEGTIYKTNNQVDIFTLPLTIIVMDGTTGQSIYGDMYTPSLNINQNQSISILMDNIVDKLLTSGTSVLADNIAKNIEKIKNTSLKNSTSVQFSLDCNVPGATAELDGAAIGSPPGNFTTKPGLHQLRITRQYFEPWEQTVNIYPNQKLTVSLEFTADGQAKFKDLAAFKQSLELEKATTYAEIDIAKQQSQADADSKEKLSSGGEVFLKNSYIRADGFAEQLTRIIHRY
ncbi:MAG: hypothetical protein A2X47_13530 [Lentisphaerae bacterium GWF2_38_69]|nr:MAG: hypothetical protein A2X47_13530 [Lentisphaerae bacterium GWF2_38_69]